MTSSIEKTTQALIQSEKQHPGKTKQTTKNFIDFLKDNRKMYQLSSIIQLLERKAQKQKRENRLQITLFKSVSQKSIQEIKKFIGAPDKSNIDININKEIKGGFIAYYQESVFNASVGNQFTKLKNTLKK